MLCVGFGIACNGQQSPRYDAYGSTKPSFGPVQHRYEISIVDVAGNPLEGATVDYKTYDRENIIQEKTFITKQDGKMEDSVEATQDPRFTYSASYDSKLTYKITKDGYYSKTGTLFLLGKGGDYKNTKEVLVKPIDYLNPSFASSGQGLALKEKILAFLDMIILKSLLSESSLDLHSIDLVTFKNKTYLQIKFTNSNVYNSLKLNKYDIGKTLFDEVVRKILTPLNDNISNPKLFFGYDLTVKGYTKSFADKYATGQPINYRYLMPEGTVRKYKNKDISGQQLLNESVILMDDERIELKLQ